MYSLIIGYGEIGKAVYEVFSKIYKCSWLDIDSSNISKTDKYSTLHISIPWSEKFVKIVNDYIKKFMPELTIIHSTVPIGTTRKLKGCKVHAPVRGRHADLALGIKTYVMNVGWVNSVENRLASDYLSKAINIKMVYSYESSEAAKLLSLLQFGMNIEFARYAKKVCNKFDISYDRVVKEYTESHNLGIAAIDNPLLVKPILDPPVGKIGGHCVIPGIAILQSQIEDFMLYTILKKNG